MEIQRFPCLPLSERPIANARCVVVVVNVVPLCPFHIRRLLRQFRRDLSVRLLACCLHQACMDASFTTGHMCGVHHHTRHVIARVDNTGFWHKLSLLSRLASSQQSLCSILTLQLDRGNSKCGIATACAGRALCSPRCACQPPSLARCMHAVSDSRLPIVLASG